MKSFKRIIKTFILMGLVTISTLFTSCNNDDKSVFLIINNLSVTEGFFGDEVTITGTGFSAIASENLVTFNGAKAEVISATPTSIKTKVPFPSSTGKVAVTVNREEAPGPVFNLTLPPAKVIGYSSFEDVKTFTGEDVTYPKSGTVVLDNVQLTDPTSDDPYVDFTATGNELGFDTSFISSDIGDSGSEPIGVLSNANMNKNGDSDFTERFQDGTQGFVGADLDGTLEIVFDTVTLSSKMVGVTLEAKFFFADNSNGYEGDDMFEIYYKVDSVLGTALVSYDATQASANLNKWITASIQVPINNIKPGNIVIRMKNNSNSETMYVDRVAIKGVTVN